jgi:DNA-binding XRE family transcriptional regulator
LRELRPCIVVREPPLVAEKSPTNLAPLLTVPDNGYILGGMNPPIFLKEWRTTKGFSYRQLAEGSGVALSGIQEIEAGSRSPTVDTLDKLAKGLGVDFHDLFKKPRRRNKPRTRKEG